VTVVGQSRGRHDGRACSPVRRPDLVEQIVTLGSPADRLDGDPPARARAGHDGRRARERRRARAVRLRLPVRRRAAPRRATEAVGPFPEDIRFVSVYSRSDGIVDWRSCLDPAAEHVEVSSSHIGMAVNREVFRAVGQALGSRRGADDALSAAA
jgi:hypothetical protein